MKNMEFNSILIFLLISLMAKMNSLNAVESKKNKAEIMESWLQKQVEEFKGEIKKLMETDLPTPLYGQEIQQQDQAGIVEKYKQPEFTLILKMRIFLNNLKFFKSVYDTCELEFDKAKKVLPSYISSYFTDIVKFEEVYTGINEENFKRILIEKKDHTQIYKVLNKLFAEDQRIMSFSSFLENANTNLNETDEQKIQKLRQTINVFVQQVEKEIIYGQSEIIVKIVMMNNFSTFSEVINEKFKKYEAFQMQDKQFWGFPKELKVWRNYNLLNVASKELYNDLVFQIDKIIANGRQNGMAEYKIPEQPFFKIWATAEDLVKPTFLRMTEEKLVYYQIAHTILIKDKRISKEILLFNFSGVPDYIRENQELPIGWIYVEQQIQDLIADISSKSKDAKHRAKLQDLMFQSQIRLNAGRTLLIYERLFKFYKINYKDVKKRMQVANGILNVFKGIPENIPEQIYRNFGKLQGN